ncbi:MAG: hypothetical protein WCY29_12205 [Novosphingobium sp.]
MKPKPRITCLAGATALLLAEAAGAKPLEWRTMSVDLPDGSVAQIRYVGDVPPRVSVSIPVVQGEAAAEAVEEAYGGLPRARRVVRAPPAAPAAPPAPPQFVVGRDMPRGSTYEYTLITTNPDGKVCTQRTEWRSRGPGREPEVRRGDTGDGCAAPVILADPGVF